MFKNLNSDSVLLPFKMHYNQMSQ